MIHYPFRAFTAATAICLISTTSHAATVNTALFYEKDNVGLAGGGAVRFDEFRTVDVGIADLRYGAEGSTGDVDAEANINFTTTYDDSIALADADSVSFSMGLNTLSFGYESFIGYDIGAFVDFDSFLGVDLDEERVIGESNRIDTDGNGDGFGSTGNNVGREEIKGNGPPSDGTVNVRANVTLDASKTTSFSVNSLEGTVLATHSSGEARMVNFALLDDPTTTLDLGLAGTWTIELVDLALRNTFDSSFGISAGYELGLAIEPGCGDFSVDTDNKPFLCAGDVGVSDDTAQLTLFDPDSFEILWGTKSVKLDSITVFDGPAPAPVPVPATLPLLVGGLGLLGVLRRRRKH